MTHCPDCPLRGRETACLGATEPAFAYFCARAAEGDPAWLRMIADRSEAGYTPPPVATPGTDATLPPSYGLPLAGDLAAAFTARVGVDRAAKWVAAKLGIEDCGCPERQAALNRLDAKLRRFLGW
jgi:hypothetical protein